MRIGRGDPVVNRIIRHYEHMSGVRLGWQEGRPAAMHAVQCALNKGYSYDEFLGAMRRMEQRYGQGWPWSWLIAYLPKYREECNWGVPGKL